MAGSSSPDGGGASDLCPRCGGVGWLRRDVPVGHPEFGQPLPCACRAQVLKQQRLARLYDLSRLGEHLRQMTFQTFLTDDIPYDGGALSSERHREEIARNLRRAVSTARHFAEDPRGWLVLFGDYGCGKTHLAVAIANQRIAQGEPVLFQVVPDLLDHLRATFAPGSTVTYDDLFEEVRSSALLILDDLGAHSSSPWAEEKLFQIVNHRYNRQLPTVVTTNIPPDQLPPRLISRMTDSGTMVAIKAPDFRGGVQAPRPSLGKLPASLRGGPRNS